MTDDRPPSAAFSGSIAREIAEWLYAIRKGWTASIDCPLPVESRRFYARTGTFTWTGGFVLALYINPPEDHIRNLYNVGALLDASSNLLDASIILGVLILFSLWLSHLIALSNRKVGPIRLFLDGLLLSTVTVSIIGFAIERIVQNPEDSPASSQSPVTLSPQ